MAKNEVPNSDGKGTPQPNGVSRRQFITRVAAGAGAIAATTVLGACGSSGTTPLSSLNAQNLSSTAWRFGVMSDTQWTSPPGDDTYNPNTSAVDVARQIQQEFINAGVKLVLHAGDLCDDGSTAGEDVRALFAQPLYNAGIGFFPLRGNHDDQAGDGAEFQRIYPQTGAVAANAGIHNATPSNVLSMTNPDAATQPSPTKAGSPFTVGSNFSSPPAYSNGLAGLSYSFDYQNVRFVLLDQFTPVGCVNGTTTADGLTWDAAYGSGSPTTIGNQQSWISSRLSGRAANSHAFVLTHKGLITCQHADGLFGSNPATNTVVNGAPSQTTFINSLAANKVGYYLNGHDHMYDRALIASPDGSCTITTILTASDSAKFYVPAGSGTNYKGSGASGANGTIIQGSTNDAYYDNPPRRTPVTQDLFTVGYYIFTVDGANVTVDYYAADVNTYTSSASEVITATAHGLNFTKRETFGYGLNGKQFKVPQGASYASGAVPFFPAAAAAGQVQDASSTATTAKILYGTNNSTVVDACQVPCVKVVSSGWAPAANGSLSDILALWGINSYQGATQADTYVLYMKPGGSAALNSKCAIASLDSNGNWTNAVNNNYGGSKQFVNGPWSNSYTTPGTYGYNSADNSVWAVLNYAGIFAIVANVS